MKRIARNLARQLAAAETDAEALAALVSDMAVARGEAINRKGLQAQVEYLLKACGPGEIESLAANSRPREA